MDSSLLARRTLAVVAEPAAGSDGRGRAWHYIGDLALSGLS
jgi:hypothetical protein